MLLYQPRTVAQVKRTSLPELIASYGRTVINEQTHQLFAEYAEAASELARQAVDAGKPGAAGEYARIAAGFANLAANCA